MADLIDAFEIIGDLATVGHDYGTGIGQRQTVSLRTERETARFALRFLENCPDDASVIDLREAIQSAYPGVLSGG
ncbi:hypothetical protein [Bosea sp. (in: a-proteobacteria)]